MKVVFPFLSAQIGGSHLSAFALMDGLRAKGFAESLVVAPEGSPILEEAERRGHAHVSSDEPPTDERHIVFEAARTPWRRKRLKAWTEGGDAIVHCNDVNALRAWWLPAKTTGARLVYHHRSLNTMTPQKRLMISQSDHVFCISQHTRANASFLKDARTTTLLNPVILDSSFEREAAQKELSDEFSIPSERKWVGFVGNLFHRKRPRTFLDVAQEAVRRRNDLHFVMFGAPREFSLDDIRSARLSRGLQDRLTIAGFRLPPERNMASLDLLFVPAVREPFGRTTVEAALTGVPYLAMSGAGYEESYALFGGGRLISPDSTVPQLTDAVLDVLDTRDQYILTPNERADMARALSPERHAESVYDVYLNLMKEGVGAPS